MTALSPEVQSLIETRAVVGVDPVTGHPQVLRLERVLTVEEIVRRLGFDFEKGVPISKP